ncbi:hypothetical protein VE03_07480 [Pseudogymnoascus sp. 23342-1-I1]|nr:hypothetical protein VE03_07480 [Pseudogymnoascus sp. 23342-1-I1]
MSSRPAAPGTGERKMVVLELDKLEGTYLDLGFWDEDIGHEAYADLLRSSRIREEDFDGNLLRIHTSPHPGIPLKNETIFRCYCTSPGLQNCRACHMRKRTAFAEGRAQLAHLERTDALARARRYKDAARHFRAEASVLEAAVAERDAELVAANAKIEALKGFLAAQFAENVAALPADHELAAFQRAADKFEAEGGNAGRSAHVAADEHHAGDAPADDLGAGGADGEGASTDSDDEDAHDGLARKRRRVSSAGPSRPPVSAGASARRRRPVPSSRPALAVPASSGPEQPLSFSAGSALAAPARSGPEMPRSSSSCRRPSSASALAVSAGSGPEKQKPAGRSSWNSRSALLDVPAAVPLASIAAAVPASRKRRASAPPTESGAGSPDDRKRRSVSPASNGGADADADSEATLSDPDAGSEDTDSDSEDTESSSSSDADDNTDSFAPSSTANDTDSFGPSCAPAPFPSAPAPAAPAPPRPHPHTRTRTGTWTPHDKNSLIAVMTSLAAGVAARTHAPVYDAALWEIVEHRLLAEHGVVRGAQACRMVWNRGLRKVTGIDERKRKDPGRLETSLQRKGKGRG